MIVTTSYKPSAQVEDKAMLIAATWQGRYVQRDKLSLDQLRHQYEESAILLVSREEIRYYIEDQTAVFFHPSMAAIRLKRLLRGETDLLLEAAGVCEGDHILDCTAGLASDAIVFSYAVGDKGQVTALESEWIPSLLIQDGLCTYDSDIPGLNEAMRRIKIKHADHNVYMKTLDARSVDTVYFDPMFRKPIEESSAINSLRELANREAITAEALEQAKRIARKSIVLKEQRGSTEFARLGFNHVLRSNTKTTYGVIKL